MMPNGGYLFALPRYGLTNGRWRGCNATQWPKGSGFPTFAHRLNEKGVSALALKLRALD